jgi:site-specific DNA-methyltransferase (adenine-specific)
VKLDRLAIGVPFKDKSNIARRGHPKDLRCRGNTWFIPYDTVQSKAEKFHHPSTFPLALPRWCIRLHGRENAVVLDPFMGTGTTVVAAELENTRGIGIDCDPSYVEIARRRLSEASQVQHVLAPI